jgi:hypothetical protein
MDTSEPARNEHPPEKGGISMNFHMPCDVDVTNINISATGADRIEFHIYRDRGEKSGTAFSIEKLCPE